MKVLCYSSSRASAVGIAPRAKPITKNARLDEAEDSLRFFVFGGCRRSQKWKDLGLWQEEEAPTEEELSRAYSNLERAGYKVDYILTHKYELGRGTRTEGLFDLCTFIDERVDFGHWYAGHWHVYKSVDEKHTYVYDSLVALE